MERRPTPAIRLDLALRDVLARDRVAALAVLTYVAATVLTRIKPPYPGATNPYYVPFLFSGLVLLSLLWRLRDVGAPREKRFWIALTAGWSFWLAAEWLFVFQPPLSNPRALFQIFLTAYYVCIVSAVERGPHVPELPRRTGLARLFSWPTVGFFVLALLIYLLLIPSATESDFDAGLFEPVYFVVLDVYLLVRFLLLVRRARTERWRTLYAALAVPVAVMLSTDLGNAVTTILSWGFRLPIWWWNLSYLFLALAVRMRHLPLAAGEETRPSPFAAEEPSFLQSIQTLGFGIALPVFHISAYELGIFEASSRGARELVAVVSLVFFGVLALVKHRVLERRAQALWLERLAFEEKLRDSTQDLRLIVERQRAAEATRQAEERFVFAFQSCPYALAIASRKGGRLLEVNPAFQETLAFSREELLKRRAADLGFRAPAVAGETGDGGETPWRRIRFRRKSGEPGRALACAVRIEALEEECVLWILREVTPHEEELVRLEEAVALFDAAAPAAAAALGSVGAARKLRLREPGCSSRAAQKPPLGS